MSMFCFQCEQTAGGSGCTKRGVCGKSPETAKLQDLLVDTSKKLGWFASESRKAGKVSRDIDRFIMEALFTTVTNVNFDPENIARMIKTGEVYLAQALAQHRELLSDHADKLNEDIPFEVKPLPDDLKSLIETGQNLTPEIRLQAYGHDVAGLQELIMYGLKGSAAYAHHAYILGQEDDDIYAFFEQALGFLAEKPADPEQLTTMALDVGKVNYRVMELLDQANTGAYGHPRPTKVRTTPVAGKAILVSGHDLKDLAELLKQTEGTGINIYTHGEMLPCHGYPEFQKHEHLVGNYGGAWQKQKREFDAFPGPILMTTNCIQEPRDSYKDRIYTSGLVEWPGVRHIDGYDFSEVIESAQNSPGFTEDDEPAFTMTGFGHNAVSSVAGDIVKAVKDQQIRHFFLIGGCDGAKSGRNYFTEMAQAVPEDCLIMTLACGKYRFNKLDFGQIGDLPRMLDVGQCNDAYSAIKIAQSLADAFNCDVNDLPLTLVLSWYEQKAVCILLTLLYLGIKNIRLGPSLPAFVSPDVFAILSDKFNLRAVTTVEEDLDEILSPTASA